jgi:DNA-binding transcriptional MerR regulator
MTSIPEATSATSIPEDDLYRIGTVAKLTDISVERLRAWERRYGVVPVYRSGKTRFYSHEQLGWLQQVKRMIDRGHPISTLVGLSAEQLAERLTSQRNVALRPAVVGLIGPNLLVLEQQTETTPRLEVQARWANMEAFTSDQSAVGKLDVIVVQLPVLLAEPIETIADLHPESRIVSVYQFATPAQISAVQELGVPTLDWPVSWQEIEHACATSAGLPLRAARTAPRRFTDEQLIAIAASPSQDEANCPAHLVELITNLNAFADYSLSCTANSTSNPALLQRVHTDTTQARAQLELALEVFVEADALLPTPN